MAKKKAKAKQVYDCGRDKGLAKKKPKGARCSPVLNFGARKGLVSVKKKAKPKRRKVTRVKRNPSGRSVQAEIAKGARLFTDFRGDPPESVERITIPSAPRALMVIGDLFGVAYETVRDGKRQKYFHEFEKKSRPALCCTPDGKQLYVIGGSYEVTDRGIEDR